MNPQQRRGKPTRAEFEELAAQLGTLEASVDEALIGHIRAVQGAVDVQLSEVRREFADLLAEARKVVKELKSRG
jgi:phosphoserine phosphatase